MTIRTRDLHDIDEGWLRRYLGDRDARTVCGNTVLVRDADGAMGVVFHATRILTFHADGSFTVNTGGYRTVTTKQRLNALLPAGFGIHQKRYVWRMKSPGDAEHDFEDGARYAGPTYTAPNGAHYLGSRLVAMGSRMGDRDNGVTAPPTGETLPGAISRIPTDRQASTTAYAWHGGQWSPLYSFASTGTTQCERFSIADLLGEIDACITREFSVGNEHGDDTRELGALRAYVAHVGARGPHPYWDVRTKHLA